MNPENPVVQLCGRGMQAEAEGRDADAATCSSKPGRRATDDYGVYFTIQAYWAVPQEERSAEHSEVGEVTGVARKTGRSRMKPWAVSPETVMGSPIALHLARELAEQSLDSPLEVNRAAVEIALSFSTGSALEDDDDSDPPADRTAAVHLVELMGREEAFIAHRELAFPQAVVSASSEAPMSLVPPRVTPHDEPAVAGKPSGALWTSSFLAPGYPAWAAMVDTGYVPVQRPFACVEFLADPEEVEVFTIDSPADFVTLCDEFAVPSEQGDLSVDWRRVSDVYHAVHLTLQGLILVQDRPLGCRLGSATLRNWDSESTAWLRLPGSAALGRRLLVD